MNNNALKTLFLPFHAGDLAWPDEGQINAFYFAKDCADLSRFPYLQIYQPYKHEWDALPVHTALDDQKKDIALCLLPKQKEEARWVLAHALDRLKEGGVLVAAAANDAGGKRLDAFFKDLGLQPNSDSKNKARVTWAEKKEVHEENLKAWLKAGAVQGVQINGKTYRSRPGLFSWDRADAGSSLLLNHLPPLSGVGADFGCGYGYLAQNVLATNPDIKTLYALDSDKRAVEYCALNTNAQPIWRDLRQKPDLPPLDFIVMNPPFHTGKMTDTDLGQSFIHTAARSLRKGGVLYMVANRQLPYEDIIDKFFTDSEKLAEEQGFKIITAIK